MIKIDVFISILIYHIFNFIFKKTVFVFSVKDRFVSENTRSRPRNPNFISLYIANNEFRPKDPRKEHFLVENNENQPGNNIASKFGNHFH